MGFFGRRTPSPGAPTLEGMRRTFASCAETSAPATVVVPDLGASVAARFAEVTDRTVVLDVLEPTLDAGVPPLSLVVVVFVLGRTTSVFVAAVEELRLRSPDPNGRRLVLVRPAQLVSAERRTAFRIPVGREVPLAATLVLPAVRVDVQVVDLSLGGALLDLSRTALRPAVGAEGTLELGIDTKRAIVRCKVCRLGEADVAVFFPDCVKDQEIAPPQDVRDLVRYVEQAWLRSRGA